MTFCFNFCFSSVELLHTNSKKNDDSSELVVTWIIDAPKDQSVRQIIESRIKNIERDTNDEDYGFFANFIFKSLIFLKFYYSFLLASESN
jgi:hypothetical protein